MKLKGISNSSTQNMRVTYQIKERIILPEA